MNYRKAEKDDVSQLVELRKRQLTDEGSLASNDISGELEAYFTSSLENGTLVCWVAKESGEIVATGGVCFFQLPPTFTNPTGYISYITNMYTKPEYRRRGIAAKLLELVMDEAAQKKYKMLLHASDMGRSLYMKSGFKDAEGFMTMTL